MRCSSWQEHTDTSHQTTRVPSFQWPIDAKLFSTKSQKYSTSLRLVNSPRPLVRDVHVSLNTYMCMLLFEKHTCPKHLLVLWYCSFVNDEID